MCFVFYNLLFSCMSLNIQCTAFNNVAPLGLLAIRIENLSV